MSRAMIFPALVRQDFNHPRLIHCFFMPVLIACLFVLTTPPWLRMYGLFVTTALVFGIYHVGLSLYVISDWLLSYDLTDNTHPLVFLHTIGFFMLSSVSSYAGLFDAAWAFFTVGALMWIVVFGTIMQNMVSALTRRRETAQPTYFIFIGPPAQALFAAIAFEGCKMAAREGSAPATLLTLPKSLEWSQLAESAFYIDMFLYALMLRLLPSIVSADFLVTWWAYIFPLSAGAGASLLRLHHVGGSFWLACSVITVSIACVAMVLVCVFMGMSLMAGDLPKNPTSLKYYRQYFCEERSSSNWGRDLLPV